MRDSILVPTTGDEGSQRAVEVAVTEAKLHNAAIQLLTVSEEGTNELAGAYDGSGGKQDSAAKQVIQRTRERIPEEIPVETFITGGVPTDEILAHIDAYDVDLVVMATHGRTGLKRAIIGSTTEAVVRRSDTPVLTVQADTE